MAKSLSLEERTKRDLEMQQFLSSIPPAKHGRTLFYELIVQELSGLEKGLTKLKAFLRFLSKLSQLPEKYFRWMEAAFAQYTPSEHTLSTTSMASTTSESKPLTLETPVSPRKKKGIKSKHSKRR